MIQWSVVERDDIHGRAYCASLNNAFCAAFVYGVTPSEYSKQTLDEFGNWKLCAENTLYTVALNWPNYQTPINELTYVREVLKTKTNEVFYAGVVLTKADLIGSLAIDHLFTTSQSGILIQHLVAFRRTGVHIARSLISTELDVWKTMVKGIE